MLGPTRTVINLPVKASLDNNTKRNNALITDITVIITSHLATDKMQQCSSHDLWVPQRTINRGITETVCNTRLLEIAIETNAFFLYSWLNMESSPVHLAFSSWEECASYLVVVKVWVPWYTLLMLSPLRSPAELPWSSWSAANPKVRRDGLYIFHQKMLSSLYRMRITERKVTANIHMVI